MLAFLNNNFYLSIIIGLTIAIIDYGLNKDQNTKMSMDLVKKYLKLGAVSALLVYIGFYIRTRTFDLPSFRQSGGGSFGGGPSLANLNSIPNQLQNINIGEPNF